MPQKASSSRCQIFWDLDNVQPTHVKDILVIGHAIRSALLDLIPQLTSPCVSPPQLPQLTVFANPTTLEKFSLVKAENITPSLSSDAMTTTMKSSTASPTHNLSSTTSSSVDLRRAIEDILGGTLIVTSERKQSVDFAMKSAMLEYVQHARKKVPVAIETTPPSPESSPRSNSRGEKILMIERENEETEIIIIACVSDDTDYVQILNYLGSNNNNYYCTPSNRNPGIMTHSLPTSSDSNKSRLRSTSSIACLTISIGEHKRRKRPLWAAPRKLDSLALPAACDAALTLSRPRKINNLANKTFNSKGARTIHENCSGGDDGDDSTEGAWRVERVWVNPKKNWKERIPI